MKDRCPSPQEVAALAAIPRGDPRRKHVDHCPRCEAIVLSYREFMDPGELPPEAESQRASRKLEAMLRREILSAAPDRRAAEASPRVQRSRGARLARWFRWPVLAPALAGAAALLIVLFTAQDQGRPGGGGTQRGPEQAATVEAERPVAASLAMEDGDLVLEWQPPAACDRSLVVFYAADLTEVGRHDAAAEQSLRLSAQDDPWAGIIRDARYWRVLCYHGEQEIARSRLDELERGTP